MFEPIIQIAEEAGRAILEVYERSEIEVETKSDSSPSPRLIWQLIGLLLPD